MICEACKGKGWILSNDSKGQDEIQFCQECCVFVGDAEAQAHVAKTYEDMFAALSQLIDRLDHHGSIDIVREEGPIEDARNAIAKAKRNA